MKLVTYVDAAGGARAGVLLDGSVLDLASAATEAGVGLPPRMLDLLDRGARGLDNARHVIEEAAKRNVRLVPPERVKLLAPLPRPRKVLAVAGNYTDHILESNMVALQKSESTIRPFMKPANSVIGPGAIIQPPKWSRTIDYEAELAIVIGSRASAVSPEEAVSRIAGYSVFNDISGRSLTIAENRTPREGDKWFDWLAGKWFDTFSILGPAIVTPDELGDPHDLRFTLTVNGEERQNASTAQMIFNCYEIVSFFSHLTTLEPGDVIATGTAAGVGSASKTYLQPGDIVEATIEGIGTLRNEVGPFPE